MSKLQVKPKVIFLDAVGTLFGVKGSVGQVYHDLARQAGVKTTVEAVDKAFYKSFKSASPMAFPDAPRTAVPHLEYRWWQAVVQQTFRRVGVLSEFEDFEAFFAEVYRYFSTAVPWVIYDDTVKSLDRWQGLGIELGVISNFDSRIYQVLEILGLREYFRTITISTEVGAAKPDALMFTMALQKHGCAAAQAWHVGDSYDEDFQAAKAAGLQGIWLRRQSIMA